MKNRLMQFTKSAVCLLALTVALSACEKDSGSDSGDGNGSNEAVLKGKVNGTRSLVADSVYLLEGSVYVESGAVLNIAPGTVIKGDKRTKGALVVKMGGKLNAAGTAAAPIIFTSTMEEGMRAAGDWGGVVICGKAQVNQPAEKAVVEGFSEKIYYGGVNNNGTDVNEDNSGTLTYCRIEYAGVALTPDNEINGLTLCGVGSGTTIHHVQVSFCGDDSFEWFGGTVNASHLIAYCGLDDDFDTDFGFNGTVQFALGVRNPRIADVSKSNGFESDNYDPGTLIAGKSVTSPLFSNVTLIGPYKTPGDKNVNGQFQAGMHLRRSTQLSCINSVVAGYPVGIIIDGQGTWDNKSTTALVLENVAVVNTAANGVVFKAASITPAPDLAAYFNTVSSYSDLAAAGLKTATFYDATKNDPEGRPTSFLPEVGSPLIAAGAGDFSSPVASANTFLDKSATYQGAFKMTDWTAGWANFAPQTSRY